MSDDSVNALQGVPLGGSAKLLKELSMLIEHP
jgi:hypothetical protein